MRLRVVVATIGAIALLVSGCSGSPRDMSMGVREAQSAVGTARLALTSSEDGDTTGSFAEAMVDEAGTRLSSASSTASAFKPTDRRTAAQLEAVTKALGDADTAIRHASEALAGFPGAPSVRDALDELETVATDLGDLAGNLEAPR
ncbi:hypothetical protein [Aeromicrobium sp. 9AM]|uniref:hypothetical protein n=1 Tax=Aeromicrobium sp. 9AM TaxID=2653126 RepID=UPI0012F2680C|nr:hypothetical protein [Aeromicrobium sp. 9AM]VXC30640.1 conserved exported hypothetical protein [Aeromicrobium sp. 9AM]